MRPRARASKHHSLIPLRSERVAKHLFSTPSLSAVGVVAVVAGTLLCLAPPAFANRTYDSRFVEGFDHPSIAVDAAADVFLSNGPEFSKYAAYPSHTLLGTGEFQPLRAENARLGSLAVDNATGQIFVAAENYGCDPLVIFDSSGTYEEEWNHPGGTSVCAQAAFAIDNTNTYSKGRIYVSLGEPINDVEVYDAKHRPVDFPASAPYIQANKLTGTPSGTFGHVREVTVGPEGNLYVVDLGRNVIDEFDSTGTFLRTFSGAGAPETFTPQGTVAIDPTNGNVLVDTGEEGVDLAVDEFDSSGNYLGAITGTGPSESSPFVVLANAGGLAVNSSGYLYVANGPGENVDIFTPNSTILPKISYRGVSSPATTSGTLNATVDPNGGAEITECQFEYGEEEGNYGLGSVPCEASTSLPYSIATEVSAKVSSLTTATTYHYRFVVKSASGTKYGGDRTYTPNTVLGLSDGAATEITEAGATLTASFLGNGEGTSYYFEWGPAAAAYGNKTAEADAPASMAETPLSAMLTGLVPYTTYHYRVVAINGSGTSYGEDRYFTTTPGKPSVKESVSSVHADGAVLEGAINPHGAATSYKFEYVSTEEFERSEWTNAATAMGSEPDVGMSKESVDVHTHVSGLTSGTTYDYRIVAENAFGGAAPVRTFTTFPFTAVEHDPCPNASLRQHTGAAQLLDCRAYELVSAANTAGYDVESNLTPGQTPLAGYPEAEGRVLYSVHDGAIPGTGSPTNRGLDPYLATRGKEAWSTAYVGIPSNATPSAAPFASTLLGADASLSTFAFGGSEICSPCFADGSTGEPLRLPGGQLVQGMTGPLDPGPSADPAGLLAKPLSSDGSHFVFGSTSKFVAGGNEGHISIYDRDLNTGETHVVSNDSAGNPIPCVINCSSNGLAELDISKDGSHILLGQLVQEREGHKYWHLYTDVNDAAQTVELTPAAVEGVQFDGMTADGTKVFFSSEEHLTGGDEQHTGAQIFMWSEATNALTLISTGDGSSCDPSANTAYAHWNTTGSNENCGALAIGGGGGVASEDGSIYFLSPEQLDGPSNGTVNSPNLYLARPGQAPQFVATLQSIASSPLPVKVHPFLRAFGSFSNPTGIAIAEAPGEEGDSYVLDVSRGFGGTVEKFDSSGNLVTGFGKQGKLDGQHARGTGSIENGSTTVESVTTTTGAFAAGQEISAPGIPPFARIRAVNPGSLEISRPASASDLSVALTAKLTFLDYGKPGRALPTEVAVDNSCAQHQPPLTESTTPTCAEFDPSYRDLYVPDDSAEAIDKFSPSGEFISQIELDRGPRAVAVDQANGDVYVAAGYQNDAVTVYGPGGQLITSFEANQEVNSLAVAKSGNVYTANGGGHGEANGETEIYRPSNTSPLEYQNAIEHAELLDANPSLGVAVDPESNVYVDEGTQVSEFDSSGHQLGAPLGTGILKDITENTPTTGSIGLAASSGSLVISNAGAGPGESGDVVAYGSVYPPSPQTDNPLVVDSASAPETQHTGDFQITPSGDDAVFTSSLAPPGSEDETAGHTEVYRYNAPAEKLTCVSCDPTGAPSAGDSSLASNGLSLTDKGGVFFNTTDQLAAGDTDEKQDVYEWEPEGTGNCNQSNPAFSKPTSACLDLISAGTSAFDSGLLGASANGTDVFFFTRDDLVPQDKNGSTVRIYDAREGGGFLLHIPPPACKASDECHGAASPAPPPLQVGTESATPRQYQPNPKQCKKGFVLKHGKCVKKHPKKHHKRASHRRGGKK
jgi:hypothetical protein